MKTGAGRRARTTGSGESRIHGGGRLRTMALAAGLTLATPAVAPEPLAAQDEATARAAVQRIFEGMRRADSAMVRGVFAPEARFAMVDARDGAGQVRVQTVDGWIEAIGRSGGMWDEQIYDVQVMVDGSMASVWAPYTFYREGSISHCGINSIEMLHDGEGWRVTQISDTRRQTECPDPLG